MKYQVWTRVIVIERLMILKVICTIQVIMKNRNIQIDTSNHDQVVKIVLPTDDRRLFPGSTIPLVVACVLLVTFIYKHNLTKSAWADLLQIICVYCPNIDTVFKSVHTMKKFIAGVFDRPEPLENRYCQKCSKLINNTDKCPGANCKNAKVNSFLYLHPDKKLKQLFSSQTFLNLLKEGKKNSHVMNENIYDIYDSEDYRTFTTPAGFLHDNYNISFTLNTDGVNKYKSSNAGNIWPVYLVINELPKEYRFHKDYMIPALIYCDKEKPNMLSFLNHLMDTLNRWYEDGLSFETPDRNVHMHSMLFICTADLPARADLLNMKHFNC